MLSEREKMQLEEHELYEDISNVEELRKQELLESYDKHSSSRRAGLIYMLIGLFFGFVSLFVYLNGSTFANQYHDIMDETSPNTPMAVDGAANILLTVILFTFIALGVLFFLFGFFSMFGKHLQCIK